MKTLTLDFSKWRSGGSGMFDQTGNVTGKGKTRLLNNEGFMCCLGQFSLQCGFKRDEILEKDDPSDLGKVFDGFNRKTVDWDDKSFGNTILSRDLININDNNQTTPNEKIKLLIEKLKDYGYELIVINTPENK